MKYTLATALALAYAQFALGLTVNTPSSVTQCQPVMLTWEGGTASYFPAIIPGGQPTAAPLKSFGKTDAQSLTWIVDLAAGTVITVKVTDSTGTVAYSDQVTVLPSADSSCLNSSAAPAAAPGTTTANGTPAAATGATPAASGSSAAASGSTAAAAPAAQRPAGTTRAAAVSASATATNGAVRSTFTYGLAGVLAAIGAALF